MASQWKQHSTAKVPERRPAWTTVAFHEDSNLFTNWKRSETQHVFYGSSSKPLSDPPPAAPCRCLVIYKESYRANQCLWSAYSRQAWLSFNNQFSKGEKKLWSLIFAYVHVNILSTNDVKMPTNTVSSCWVVWAWFPGNQQLTVESTDTAKGRIQEVSKAMHHMASESDL